MDGELGLQLTFSNAGSLIRPFLIDAKDMSYLPYFASHLTTLRPLTTISLYRQNGSIRGVLLTREPEQSVLLLLDTKLAVECPIHCSAGGHLSGRAIEYHEQQYDESICDLDDARIS